MPNRTYSLHSSYAKIGYPLPPKAPVAASFHVNSSIDGDLTITFPTTNFQDIWKIIVQDALSTVVYSVFNWNFDTTQNVKIIPPTGLTINAQTVLAIVCYNQLGEASDPVYAFDPEGINVGGNNGDVSVKPPFWWSSGDGTLYPFNPTGAGQLAAAGSPNANVIKVWMTRILNAIIVKRLSTSLLGGLTTSFSGFGIYVADTINGVLNPKVLSWDAIDTHTGTGSVRTIVLPNAIVIAPGVYYYASACDTTGTSPTTLGGYTTEGTNAPSVAWNTHGYIRSGIAASVLGAGGVMPASLGVISLSANISIIEPMIIMDPA